LKKGIHPEYKDAIITCVCGAVYKTKSTKERMRVEVCAKCHPFFTGQYRIVGATGRAERFQKKYGLRESGEE